MFYSDIEVIKNTFTREAFPGGESLLSLLQFLSPRFLGEACVILRLLRRRLAGGALAVPPPFRPLTYADIFPSA